MESDFYLEFENKFRGNRQNIINKLSIYTQIRIKVSKQNLARPSCLVCKKILILSLDRLMNLIKRLFTSVIASTLLVSSSFNHVKASDREVRIYSGRHYNTDRQVFKKFSNSVSGTLNCITFII